VGVPDTNDNGTSTLAGPSHPPPPYPGTVFPAWDNKPLTLGILLFPGFELLDVTGPLQWVGFKEIMRVSFVSKDGKGVTATQNVTAKVQYSFKTAPVFDVILVPGGGGTYAALNDTDLIQWIK
jgi:putative intracellular protease/amidase